MQLVVCLYCTLLWQLAEAGSHANFSAGHCTEQSGEHCGRPVGISIWQFSKHRNKKRWDSEAPEIFHLQTDIDIQLRVPSWRTAPDQ